ncbi:exopolyphosphatase [bacterium]|nr:exopolyphosphatase [bacterium]
MRLVTRSDFDGLACAVLLVEAGLVDTYLFVHPKDLQDGKIPVCRNDILANVPFVPGCGMWFDHHASEHERLQLVADKDYIGSSVICQSCARVIYNYFGGHERYAKFDRSGMMEAVDRCDSGQLSVQEILDPRGWVLLSFIMDPRTGLGRHRGYRISNYQLMLDMIQYCRRLTPDEILQLSDVQERTERYFEQEISYTAMIHENARVKGNLLIIDLMDVQEIMVGNRFKEYALYPQTDVSLRIMRGKDSETVVFTCGHSILKRTCTVNVGELMLRYGGGGHTRVGTCQVPAAYWQRVRDQLVAELTALPAWVRA